MAHVEGPKEYGGAGPATFWQGRAWASRNTPLSTYVTVRVKYLV